MMTRARWATRLGPILLASAGLFVGLCLLTYHAADTPFLSSSPQQPPANLGGAIGVWVGFLGRGGFGWGSFLVCGLCALWAWRLWRGPTPEVHGTSLAIGTIALLASVSTLAALLGTTESAQVQLGGLSGFLLARAGTYYLGTAGTVLTACCVALMSWTIVSGQAGPALGSIGLTLLRRVGSGVGSLIRRPTPATLRLGPSTAAGTPPVGPGARPQAPGATEEDAEEISPGHGGGAPGGARSAIEGEPPRPEGEAGSPPAARAVPALPHVRIRSTVEPRLKTIPTPPRRQTSSGFQLPPHHLLSTPPPLSERQISEDLQANAKVLEETLREFGIEATVVNIDRGPTVTRYELTPAPGVKLTKIVSLADELALVMKAASCHIVAPIPGKGRVGIDVPNRTTTMVYLKEIITAYEFTGNPSPLALPIGKDVSGHPLVTDLRECPHLLVAGATGSGKTVCLNSLLTGIVMRASPEQVRFLMIDPKMVELAMFNDLPHLIAPVVTSAKRASVALHWAVQEMERRYQLFASLGVRNIEFYNKRLSAQPVAEPAQDPAAQGKGGDGKPLPYLVIVIDELADLMMVAAQDVEGAITRLAQLSRAVGLHMILATQRPSVDVITGVIKANFPARIAFQVASKVDSRTILDANGADKLLGRGDLLFLRPGTAKPIRAQGAFVTDGEIEQITAFLKAQRAPSYDERLVEQSRQPEGASITEKDELYEMAKRLVLDTGQASTSLLQRRLRLGYGRAARILDLMEQEGLVGPPQGSRPREILVSHEAMKQGANG
jgi:S-DNA-T family DNA segregation ATPase FtsK/SpoIIIE